MNRKIILAGAVLTAAFYFGQVSASKIVKGGNGLHPEFVEYGKSGPEFKNTPVVYNEATKMVTETEGKQIDYQKDKLGVETYRYQQTLGGIPVEYGMMTMQTKNGKILSQAGTWIQEQEFSRTKLGAKPSVSAEIALQNALSFVGASLYKWQDAEEETFLKNEQNNKDVSFKPKAELVYYSNPDAESLSNLKLAYKFDIYASEPLSRQYVFVDAKTGTVLGTESLIHETNAPGTATTGYSGTQTITTDKVSTTSYRLRETGRNGGTSVQTYNMKKGTRYASAVDFTDTDNNWNNVNTTMDQYATDAHWGAEKTLDFYYQKFGRKSIDNNNFSILSYVHYSKNYFNAFWDGTRMTYGDGSSTYVAKPLTAIDVCGHEISHGLTSKTANLAYQKESGAMNEGFSDIFGNSIEAFARPTKYSWQVGEDFYVIRDMSNPNSYSQPDTYGGKYWYKITSCTPSSSNDYCGVHTNSGVLNYWYYLLVQGGSGTNDNGFAFNVTGIGFDKAAAIAYRTLTTYLTSSSTYANARTYSIQAATDLYGSGSTEVTQTTNAWNAVGVGGGLSSAGKTVANTSATTTYRLVNVSNGNFNINFTSENESVKTIDVYSTTGIKVVSKTASSTQGDNSVNIQIPGTTLSGVYYVVIDGQKVGAVIKK